MTQIQFNNALLGLSDKLHYYALSLTSNSERADDLLQETFLKALTYRDKFTQNTNFKAWIYTIMKNTFINDYRRNVKTKNTFDGSNNDFHLMFSKDKVYPAPDSFYSTKEIHKNINALEDEYKVPFTLFLDGYKYKEIAEKLELPLGTVKSRIFFTRKSWKNRCTNTQIIDNLNVLTGKDLQLEDLFYFGENSKIMKNIAVHLADGFEEIEAVAIIDVLRRAGLTVFVVSITGKLVVSGSHKIQITADDLFEHIDYNAIDMIILPGGMPGAKNLNNHNGLKKQIIQFNKERKYLGAICAAPMVFGQLGILKNQIATCYPGFESYLEGAEVSGAATEVRGNIITGKGAGVAIQFALRIVEMIKGNEAARELADKMIVKY